MITLVRILAIYVIGTGSLHGYHVTHAWLLPRTRSVQHQRHSYGPAVDGAKISAADNIVGLGDGTNNHGNCFSSSTALHMGLFDSISNFLNSREGDFIQLEKTETEFGPGPALLLYNVPPGIEDDEFQKMVSDGAPKASSKGVILRRIDAVSRQDDDDEETNSLLDQSVEDALDAIIQSSKTKSSSNTPKFLESSIQGCPVLFFSGFDNQEMMTTYNIIGQEIFHESGGRLSPACAKAVPNAMLKPLRQVLEEISGDHMDAMRMEQSQGDE